MVTHTLQRVLTHLEHVNVFVEIRVDHPRTETGNVDFVAVDDISGLELGAEESRPKNRTHLGNAVSRIGTVELPIKKLFYSGLDTSKERESNSLRRQIIQVDPIPEIVRNR